MFRGSLTPMLNFKLVPKLLQLPNNIYKNKLINFIYLLFNLKVLYIFSLERLNYEFDKGGKVRNDL